MDGNKLDDDDDGRDDDGTDNNDDGRGARPTLCLPNGVAFIPTAAIDCLITDLLLAADENTDDDDDDTDDDNDDALAW